MIFIITLLTNLKGCLEGTDPERGNIPLLNEDRICDELEEIMKTGKVVLDTHALVDFFPERWFGLVVVLTCNNTVLFDRLRARGYVEYGIPMLVISLCCHNTCESSIICEYTYLLRKHLSTCFSTTTLSKPY